MRMRITPVEHKVSNEWVGKTRAILLSYCDRNKIIKIPDYNPYISGKRISKTVFIPGKRSYPCVISEVLS